MISIQDSVKYIGLALIIFCLIKAFTRDTVNNLYLIVLVVGILLLVYFITYDCSCNKSNKSTEGFNPTTGLPIEEEPTPSIYATPPDAVTPHLEKRPETLDFDVPPGNEDKDIQNMKDIVGIDKKTYRQLIRQEEKAMEKIADTYKDEMVYTDTHPFNTVPLGTQLYGYTYLPPENWFRAYERPPVCVTDQRCPVIPIYSGKETSDLLEFDTANNVTGPQGINRRYIKRILNDDVIPPEEFRSNGQPKAVAIGDNVSRYKETA